MEKYIGKLLDLELKYIRGEISEEELTKEIEKITKEIMETDTFKSIYQKLLQVDKEILASVLSWFLVLSPYGTEMADAMLAKDDEMFKYFSKMTALNMLRSMGEKL